MISPKGTLRAAIRQHLKQIGVAPSCEVSARERLENQPAWQNARLVLAYWATGHELNLWPTLAKARAQGKIIAFPRFDPATQLYAAAEVPNHPEELVPAGFGILEPPAHTPIVPLNQLDFILVPGLAFDVMGRRLGRGKGFYDRLLAQVKGIKCGVALDEQIVDALPAEPHDIAMNIILTPTRWLVLPPPGS